MARVKLGDTLAIIIALLPIVVTQTVSLKPDRKTARPQADRKYD